VAIVGFFSVPRSKLIGYVLPVLPPLALLAALGWERVMGRRPWAGKLFAGLCVLAVGLAMLLDGAAARHARQHGTRDIAQVLACAARADDTVYALGDYPYDLPFYTQSRRPMVVIQDWPALRRSAGDNWRRELFEGADFDAVAARVLQTPDVLDAAKDRAGQWLVVPKADRARAGLQGWAQVREGAAWALYRSNPQAGSAPERPEAAQQKGLPGCQNQGRE